MICRINVKKYWVYKLFYTILTLIVVLVPIMFAIDPLNLSSSINMGGTVIEQDYAIDAALSQITVTGPLGLVAGQESTVFNASVDKKFDPSVPPQVMNCLFFGSNEAFYAAKTSNIIQTLAIKTDGSFYKQGSMEFTCIDLDSKENLGGASTTGTALIIVAIIILVVMVLFIWLTCEGWCRCNSPIKSSGDTSAGAVI